MSRAATRRPAARPAARSSSRAGLPRRTATGAVTALRLVAAAGRAAPGGARRALTLSPSGRRRLAALMLAGAVLGAVYAFWLRDSSFVKIEDVAVTGLSGPDAGRAGAALAGAAREMTTLNLDRDRLERTAAAFPTVRALELDRRLPDGLAIRVLEHQPIAIVVDGDRRVPVAADGSILSGLPVGGRLPELAVEEAASERLEPGSGLASARVAGGAPAELRSRLGTVSRGPDRGIVITLRDGGAELVFGPPTQIAAKWAAATRVLADGIEGATYVDLHLPDRPVAGGLPASTIEPIDEADPLAPAEPVVP